MVCILTPANQTKVELTAFALFGTLEVLFPQDLQTLAV